MDAASELIKLSSSDSIYGTLSNFDIEKKIGKGQFSVVYRARCKVDHAVLALKKVQIFEMMDSKARLDCMKEINLLQNSGSGSRPRGYDPNGGVVSTRTDVLVHQKNTYTNVLYFFLLRTSKT
ncbi:Serine/threonine-protein kinase Nek7 [Chionoecetes opilio]|uniref:NEK6-subfamily protein kinase n=1 Tax=Chionoecetes opilio TaxID=41210 RepID=A0A8J4Y6R5_CHIOP|nr:Serine/threonine-protein kinase Nek7 [Chionoecetes opilio]